MVAVTGHWEAKEKEAWEAAVAIWAALAAMAPEHQVVWAVMGQQEAAAADLAVTGTAEGLAVMEAAEDLAVAMEAAEDLALVMEAVEEDLAAVMDVNGKNVGSQKVPPVATAQVEKVIFSVSGLGRLRHIKWCGRDTEKPIRKKDRL